MEMKDVKKYFSIHPCIKGGGGWGGEGMYRTRSVILRGEVQLSELIEGETDQLQNFSVGIHFYMNLLALFH